MKAWTWLPVALVVAASAGATTGDRLDGILAIVNNEVVLESDVEEQLYLYLLRSQAQPDSALVDTLRSQILEQLIDEKLIVAEAKRQGLTVQDSEVSRQVEEALREAKERMGSPEAFAVQLQRENLTEEALRDKYRAEVRRQMLAQRVVQKQITRKPVSQAEAESYFRAHPEKFPKVAAEVRVSVIQIPATADSATEARAKGRAAEARRRILGGEKFARVASEVSEDPGSARAGGDLGFFTRGTMEPAFEEAAFTQRIGQVGQPVRSSFGWHVIEVVDRDTLKTVSSRDSLGRDGRPIVETHARHILIRVEIEEADAERARKLAERVRKEVVGGGDFGALVKRYSRYQGPQAEGGDLGFLSLSQLRPNIRTGLDTLQVGEISEVLVNASGFNIFKVTDRKPERPFTIEEIRDDLSQVVGQIQFREKYEAWVKGLRAKAQVEIRKS